MKIKSIFRALFMTSVISTSIFFQSCEKDKSGDTEITYGNIKGVVKDNQNNTIEAVTVSIKGLDATVQTDADGEFVFNNAPVKSQLVSFAKKGYVTVGMTVQASSFKDGEVILNPILQISNASISGTVLDARNGGKPFEGVSVSAGGKTGITDSEGKFLIENLIADEYIVRFTAEGVKSIDVKVMPYEFIGDELVNAEIPAVYMGGNELLPGLTAQDLQYADKWYYNEYRGGKGNGGGVVDWSTVYMSTWKFVGAWENQNEGCTLQINNSGSEQNNPADLENFDTFTYGSKTITEENKIMTLYCRTHNAETKHVMWGVRIIDITDMLNPTSELVGGVREINSSDNTDIVVDLSKYVGKTVIIAIGHFRAETGDYWNQFVMRKISFGPEANKADEYLKGTAVTGLEGWHMTNEMVKSTMTNELTSFSGVPSVTADGRGGKGYNPWNGTNHIAAQWAFMFVNKDVEPTAGEGFVIKVRGDAPANLKLPESYFYGKFNIDGNHDRMTFTTRNGDSGKYTYFKVTAIEENGTATHLSPVEHRAEKAESAGEGCWKFINNKGDAGNVKDYAAFTYDLSSFSGKNIVLAIGVFKGETIDGEQKLFFHSINFE